MTGSMRSTMVVCVLIATAAVSGCYSFTGASVPSHLRTVGIPLVDDQSGYGDPTLREQFTTALTNLFISDNSLEVADRTTADAVLEGTILSISDAPTVIQQGAGQQQEQVSKRRITMTVKFAFQDKKLRRTVWEKTFSDWGDYDAGTGGPSQRQVGLQAATQKVTEDILLETVSGW